MLLLVTIIYIIEGEGGGTLNGLIAYEEAGQCHVFLNRNQSKTCRLVMKLNFKVRTS